MFFFHQLILPSLFSLASADLPVHCLRSQLMGRWKFSLSPPQERRTTCGHRTPDVESDQPSLKDKFTSHTQLDVTLEKPNKASIRVSPSPAGLSMVDIGTQFSEKQGSEEEEEQEADEGSWTMIYDEGFNLKSEKYDLFSFSRFHIPSQATVNGKKFFQSFCGQTGIGWYTELSTGKHGCFKAERTDRKDTVFYHLSLLARSKSRSFLAAYDGFEQRLSHSQGLAIADKLEHDKIVQQINSRDAGWTAATYSQDFMAEKITEFHRKAVRKVSSGRRLPDEQDLNPNQPSSSEKEEMSLAELSSLPKQHDWSNVDGKSYLDEILDQADCGSCYAVASIHMLGARWRVKHQDPDMMKPRAFSVNFPLYCSDFNQGCNGGYPSLVAMWSRDVGLVPHKCTGKYFSSSSATCKSALPEDFSTCVDEAERENKVAKVESWNYIGGYYGGCTPGKMMQDLFKHGPMAVALEPAADFMYYKSGIYKSTSLAANVDWVKVDHAVLLIGWGESKGKKFWTIQNSWGNGWGEDGKIRLVRGENESGVEFQAVSALVTSGKGSKIKSYLDEVAKMS